MCTRSLRLYCTRAEKHVVQLNWRLPSSWYNRGNVMLAPFTRSWYTKFSGHGSWKLARHFGQVRILFCHTQMSLIKNKTELLVIEIDTILFTPMICSYEFFNYFLVCNCHSKLSIQFPPLSFRNKVFVISRHRAYSQCYVQSRDIESKAISKNWQLFFKGWRNV